MNLKRGHDVVKKINLYKTIDLPSGPSKPTDSTQQTLKKLNELSIKIKTLNKEINDIQEKLRFSLQSKPDKL